MAVLVYFYFPETSRMTIEEISMVFDYPIKNARQHVLDALEAKRQAEGTNNKLDGGEEDIKALEQEQEAKPKVQHVERV